MQRIVVIAAGMAGIATATRLKRRLPSSEVVLILPAALEKLRVLCTSNAASAGPVTARLAAVLPDLVTLATRRVGIVEAQDISTSLDEKEVTVTSARGGVTIRYSDLILEAPALVRLPRALQRADNVFTWPLPGFSSAPDACDTAIKQALDKDTPVIVTGKGTTALDAVLLALEAGASVRWLMTGEDDVPDIDPLVLHQVLKALGSVVECVSLPDTRPDELDFRLGADNSMLESLVTPDGTEHISPCFIWTSPLMGRHPILREDGVSLDPYGRLTVEDGLADELMVMGGGSAVPSALLPGTPYHAPVFPGCDDYAPISAHECVDRLASNQEAAPLAGSLGIATASGRGVHLSRAGYSLALATREGMKVEYAVVSQADPVTGEPALVLSLVCCKQSRSLLGVQVTGFAKPGVPDAVAAAQGVFDVCVAALAEGTAIDALRSRAYVSASARLLSEGASILGNKLANTIFGISPDEFVASATGGAEFFTLDLRPLHDWQSGHIPNAYNIPLPQLKKRLQDEVPHFTPIVLVSEDGRDAYAAACKLAALGATALYVLDGGMRLWPFALVQE